MGGVRTEATATLDDSAPARLPESSNFTGNRYKPTNYGDSADFTEADGPDDTSAVSLARFKGIEPNGASKLWVTDDAAEDSGEIAGGWSLKLCHHHR